MLSEPQKEFLDNDLPEKAIEHRFACESCHTRIVAWLTRPQKRAKAPATERQNRLSPCHARPAPFEQKDSSLPVSGSKNQWNASVLKHDPKRTPILRKSLTFTKTKHGPAMGARSGIMRSLINRICSLGILCGPMRHHKTIGYFARKHPLAVPHTALGKASDSAAIPVSLESPMPAESAWRPKAPPPAKSSRGGCL